MDYFQNDGIDNHQQVEQMLEHMRGFEEAYRGLSKPLQKYFAEEYPFQGIWLYAIIAHLGTATEAFSELMGVED